MTKEAFLEKWTNLNYVKNEKSIKVIDKETEKSVIWVMPKNNNIGVNTYYGVSLELMADFVELMRDELKVW
ncbi:hypothetical protein [Spiroplasma turonicum]|uniref:Uncharacterized protein n=1 Tax=Spiroplasma turonicum TaxID=216946 RepID=A0A0K1P5Q3_9MOLU|nr:hypothetical protein [Spiroplasma turonicum]AKU79661.1 hypothetical protein STURON_00415 [Spiroplasma turonicum]ALX70681.1 hypothetical protein STURO_v1c04130 [Spiroplasma turonicum]